MLIIRGVNVFPSQIEAALLAVEGTLPHYQIVLTRAEGPGPMEVQVEVTPEVFSDEVGALESLHGRLIHDARPDARAARRCPAGGAADHPAQRGQGQAVDRPARNQSP